MIAYIIALSALTSPVQGGQSWDDFANNFATDLAPILVLFGEQVTKQFLSESTSFLDCVIFAAAPLGVLTAVVSVIRVCGTASLKAFIGRSQEAHGIAEAELCSSTSRDVCELWSNGGISRIFGRPKIIEFVYDEDDANFYRQFVLETGEMGGTAEKDMEVGAESETGEKSERPQVVTEQGIVEVKTEQEIKKEREERLKKQKDAEEKAKNPSCGLHRPEILFDKQNCWTEVNKRPIEPNGNNTEAAPRRFAPHPNLSLNIGIRPFSSWLHWLVAIFGVFLQSGFFGYAAWASYYAPNLWENGKPPKKWAFPLAATGTALLVTGMGLCAMLIDRRTQERTFAKPKGSKPVIFWLQPGGQCVGDQIFSAFASWEGKEKYVTSWKVDGHSVTPEIIVWIAIVFTLLGFVFQFVGFRSLHASITLYQLVATICMAIIRAALRSKRMDETQNQLPDDRKVEGHELDWIALQLSRVQEVQKPEPSWHWQRFFKGLRKNYNDLLVFFYISDQSKNNDPATLPKVPQPLWRIVDTRLINIKPVGNTEPANTEPSEIDVTHAAENTDSTKHSPSIAVQKNIEYLESVNPTSQRIIGFRRTNIRIGSPRDCAQAAVKWIQNHETNNAVLPNKAASIMRYRTRLAYLTDDGTLDDGQRWDTEVRKIAAKLKNAIETTATMFSDDLELLTNWKDAEALVWSSTCQLSKPAAEPKPSEFDDKLPIHFLLYRDENKRGWFIDKHQLEAVVGIWKWSLTVQSRSSNIQDEQNPFFSRKAFLVGEANRTEELVSTIRLWISHSLNIDKELINPSINEGSIHPYEMSHISPTECGVSLKAHTALSITVSSLDEVKTALNEPARVVLSTPSNLSPLELIAQDIFKVFMDRISNILKPLTTVECRSLQLLGVVIAPTDQPFLGLTNSTIEFLAQKFVQSGLGTQEDALMSVIPSLLQNGKLPSLKDLGSRLIRIAQRERRSGNFQKCMDILLGLLHIEDSEIQISVVRNLGQLYRSSILSSNDSDKSLSKDVGGLLKKLASRSDKELADLICEYNEVVKHYEYTDAKEEKLDFRVLGNTNFEKARIFGLLLSAKYDLSGATKENIAEILRWAITTKCPELIEELWYYSPSSINDTRLDGVTPLFFAVEMDYHRETFQALLDWPGVTIEATNASGAGLLAVAAERCNLEHVRALLDAGADANWQQRRSRSALQAASCGGDVEVVKVLLEAKADVNAEWGQYGTALQAAGREGHTGVVRILLEAGANVNAEGTYGTALQMAAINGNEEVVRMLLEAGADVSAESRHHGTVLQMVAANSNEEVVRMLLEAGADVNAEGRYYGTVLQIAAANGNEGVVRILLEAGANVNAEGRYGTALQMAAMIGNEEMVRMLLEAGANVNAEGGDDGTALQRAVECGNKEVVRMLLKAGASHSGSRL
ncbi:hypothetical protein TWF694_005330 [Orbilia ellipsospora]|uniref:Ankyrin repeat protein n=1 Tax=Orbilia ellipsospora TaxID=2528407 RepID=A0AAV9WUZ6_9PEZI